MRVLRPPSVENFLKFEIFGSVDKQLCNMQNSMTLRVANSILFKTLSACASSIPCGKNKLLIYMKWEDSDLKIKDGS